MNEVEKMRKKSWTLLSQVLKPVGYEFEQCGIPLRVAKVIPMKNRAGQTVYELVCKYTTEKTYADAYNPYRVK